MYCQDLCHFPSPSPRPRVVDCCAVAYVAAACSPADLPPVLQFCLGVAPPPSTWSVIQQSLTLHTQIAPIQPHPTRTPATRGCSRVRTTRAAPRHAAPSVGSSVRTGRARTYWRCTCRGSTSSCTTDCRLARQVNI